jgi:hypothetical protein
MSDTTRTCRGLQVYQTHEDVGQQTHDFYINTVYRLTYEWALRTNIQANYNEYNETCKRHKVPEFKPVSEISGSYGDEYEDDSLLGYCAV